MIFPQIFQLLLVLTLAITLEGKLPLLPGIKPCSIKLSPAELSACATKSANEGVPIIVKGNRQYKIPVLDPLNIEKMVINQGDGGVGFNLDLQDAVLRGLANTFINDTSMDLETKTISYEAFIPKIDIVSKYEVSGRILVMPVTGRGDSNFVFDNVNVKYVYDYIFEKRKDGEYYLVPQPHKYFDFTTTHLSMYLDNLFNGDKLLGDNTNKLLNENWADVLESLKPVVMETISQLIHSIQSKVFSKVAFKDTFLDTENFKYD